MIFTGLCRRGQKVLVPVLLFTASARTASLCALLGLLSCRASMPLVEEFKPLSSSDGGLPYFDAQGQGEADAFLAKLEKHVAPLKFKKLYQRDLDLIQMMTKGVSPCPKDVSGQKLNDSRAAARKNCVGSNLILTNFTRDHDFIYVSAQDESGQAFLSIANLQGSPICSIRAPTQAFRKQQVYIGGFHPLPEGGILVLLNAEKNWRHRFANSFQLLLMRSPEVGSCAKGKLCSCFFEDFSQAGMHENAHSSLGENQDKRAALADFDNNPSTNARESRELFSTVVLYPLEYEFSVRSFRRDLKETFRQIGVLLANQTGENSWYCDLHAYHCAKLKKIAQKPFIIEPRQCWGSAHYTVCSAFDNEGVLNENPNRLFIFAHTPGERDLLAKIDAVFDIPAQALKAGHWFFGLSAEGLSIVNSEDRGGLCVNDVCWQNSVQLTSWVLE